MLVVSEKLLVHSNELGEVAKRSTWKYFLPRHLRDIYCCPAVLLLANLTVKPSVMGSIPESELTF